MLFEIKSMYYLLKATDPKKITIRKRMYQNFIIEYFLCFDCFQYKITSSDPPMITDNRNLPLLYPACALPTYRHQPIIVRQTSFFSMLNV